MAIYLLGLTTVTLACSSKRTDANERSYKKVGSAPTVPSKAESSPIQVYFTRSLVGSKVRYSYRIANGSAFPITDLKVGFDHAYGTSEIRTPPGGWDVESPPDTTYAAPMGWMFDFVAVEGDTLGSGFAEWKTTDPTKAVLGGQSASGFTVIVTSLDAAYEELGHWTVFTNSLEAPYFTGQTVAESITDVDKTPLDSQRRIVVDPNPSTREVRARFSMQAASSYSAWIFDVQGRLIKRLAVGKRGRVGTNDVAWDGKTEQGQRVASGTYFLRIKTEREDLYARFVMVR